MRANGINVEIVISLMTMSIRLLNLLDDRQGEREQKKYFGFTGRFVDRLNTDLVVSRDLLTVTI